MLGRATRGISRQLRWTKLDEKVASGRVFSVLTTLSIARAAPPGARGSMPTPGLCYPMSYHNGVGTARDLPRHSTRIRNGEHRLPEFRHDAPALKASSLRGFACT